MDAKSKKKKLLWRLSKSKNEVSSKLLKTAGPVADDDGALRSVFMDDTALASSQSRSSLPEQGVAMRRPRTIQGIRDCRSICIAPSAEQNFLTGLKVAGLSLHSKVHDIYVWHRSQLFRISRVCENEVPNELEFLKKLYLVLLPNETLPGDITRAFHVLDNQLRTFRPIQQNEVFSNGALLKLLTTGNKSITTTESAADGDLRTGNPTQACVLAQTRQQQQPQPSGDSRSSSSNSSDSTGNPPILLRSCKVPDVLSAPLLGRRNLTKLPLQIDSLKAEPRSTSSCSSSTSPESMHSQTPSGGTPTRLPLHSTLIPATMQVGANGERHLILHYPDGQSVAALPAGQTGQIQLVPILATTTASANASSAATNAASGGQPTIRLLRTKWQGNDDHPHQGHYLKTKAGQLVCTCPPELHQSIRQSHIDGALQATRVEDDEVNRRLKLASRTMWSGPMLQTDLLNRLSGDSSEAFQESDSSGGSSSQGRGVPSVPDGALPRDLLLTTTQLPSKPPQTLEEAQHRIAQMENQLLQLTACYRASTGRPPSNFPLSVNHSKNSDSSTKCPATDDHEISSNSTSSSHSKPCNRQRLLNTYKELKSLRSDLCALKETHATNSRQMNTVIQEVSHLLVTSMPKYCTPVRSVQLRLDNHLAEYKSGYQEVERWLADLDACIEQMRVDAINRRCRVSVAEVETYALHLSRLSQRLASFKGQIPEICNASNLLALINEAEVKNQNEILCNEPKRIDMALSTCKQLTCTLFTLKRLASVQENGISINVPTFRTLRDPRPEDKKLYLQQISKIVPNHDARMLGLACHEKTRERRKRMLALRDSLYFEGAVEQSECNLREILRRLNELNRELLPLSPIPSEEEAVGQPGALPNPGAVWICPLHRDIGKAPGICCTNCEALRSGKSCRGSGDGESSTPPSSTSSEQSAVPATAPHPPVDARAPKVPLAPRGPRRAHVVFSRTVLVDAGRETTRLNCPSDLDETDEETSVDDGGTGVETGSDADELHQPWRRERMHRGNRVVDIHPGLPRNEYVICDGRCGAPACAQGSCPARQKGSTGSVLKTTTAYGPNAISSSRNSNTDSSQLARSGSKDFEVGSIDSEESEKQPVEPTSVHEMRAHHQCCRLNNPGSSYNPSSSINSN